MNLIIYDKELQKNYQQKVKQRVSEFKIAKILELYEEIVCVG